jgi:hypothetical protein
MGKRAEGAREKEVFILDPLRESVKQRGLFRRERALGRHVEGMEGIAVICCSVSHQKHAFLKLPASLSHRPEAQWPHPPSIVFHFQPRVEKSFGRTLGQEFTLDLTDLPVV